MNGEGLNIPLIDKISEIEAFCQSAYYSKGSVTNSNGAYSCNWFSISSTREDSDVLI